MMQYSKQFLKCNLIKSSSSEQTAHEALYKVGIKITNIRAIIKTGIIKIFTLEQ